MGMRTAIFGASGYAGGELVRLVDGHPSMETVHLAAHSAAGSELGAVHPHLDGPQRVLAALDGPVPDVDLAFLALPHGASADLAALLRRSGVMVVDLGADHRFSDPTEYAGAYDRPHPHPEELGSWVYGLPELVDVAGSRSIAVPGCYPTATALALAPLLSGGLVDPEGIVVDAVSGVTGAGRAPGEGTTFGAVAESVRAYKVGTHRHRPEMEHALGRITGTRPSIVFTPHLVPMQRGLLATVYARCRSGLEPGDLVEALEEAYRDRPFVTVVDEPPQTRWVVGSNRCLLAAFVDEPTGTAVVLSAIDNLVKGAAGQAVQAANVALGLDEGAGLTTTGWMP